MMKPKKCYFAYEKLKFLAHIVNDVLPDPVKS